jgi:hypothetical protein
VRRLGLSAFRPGSLREERGDITLLELLVAAPMALILLVATLNIHVASSREQQRGDSRAHALVEERGGLERMTRELRQATSITPVSSTIADAELWLRPPDGGEAVKRRVRYDCSRQTCERSEGAAGGSLGQPAVIVPDVLNADVFDYQPDLVNPDYLTITIEVRVAGATNPISLHDGVALRNLTRES